MSEVVFNNLSGFFKNYLYIGDYANVWEVIFGLTLCHSCKNPNSRVCCAPLSWIVKNYLYIGGHADVWQVFFSNIMLKL